ncbi:MAG TPA: hemerythrin domain-containing protein [Anaeromyxobacteraceae bacterium]|nr:hemerythrin domain-containing protein [Anaeromyxobacteraceae bacterium]
MTGPIRQFLSSDHDRLDTILRSALARPGEVDLPSFRAFRAGLLRHIALEEKILLPAARAARSGEPLSVAERLRVEHGALTSLLVPTPSREIVAEIRSILGPHNEVEESDGGLYDACDALLARSAPELIERMRTYPEVKVAPFKDGPGVHRTAASALAGSARQIHRPPATPRSQPPPGSTTPTAGSSPDNPKEDL